MGETNNNSNEVYLNISMKFLKIPFKMLKKAMHFLQQVKYVQFQGNYFPQFLAEAQVFFIAGFVPTNNNNKRLYLYNTILKLNQNTCLHDAIGLKTVQ